MVLLMLRRNRGDIYPMIKELSQYWYPGFTAMDNNEALSSL